MNIPLVLSAIVISYNTRQLTMDCLRALCTDLNGISAEVFVVDNASTDGSSVAIRAAFPHAYLIENSHNVGFGEANNQAMKEAQGEFFLLLNSDALLKKGTVGVLLDYLHRHPKVAVVGPRVSNPNGSLQLSCFRFQSPFTAWLENLWVSSIFPNNPIFGNYRRWAHDSDRVVDYVIGACMLVRREAYEEVGGFDERFFMYAEESDWQRRMSDKGWTVAFTPTAEVIHIAGASGAAEKRTERNHYFYGSLDLYYLKHYGLLGLIFFRLAMVVGSFLRMILWAIAMVFGLKTREGASSKARLYSWLVVRQLTYWKFGNKL